MFVYHVYCEQVERSRGVSTFDGLIKTRSEIVSVDLYRELKEMASVQEFNGAEIMIKSLSLIAETED